MRSAFYILLCLIPYLLSAGISQVKVNDKLVNIRTIDRFGVEYAEADRFLNKLLERNDADNLTIVPGSYFVGYEIQSYQKLFQLKNPVVNTNGTITVPLHDFIIALDTFKLLKVERNGNNFTINHYNSDEYKFPNISHIEGKFNLTYFNKVYQKINNENIRRSDKKPLKNSKLKGIIEESIKIENLESGATENIPKTHYILPKGIKRKD